MKKNILITIMLFLIIFFGGCSRDENKNIYGNHELHKYIYLPIQSSNKPDYLDKIHAGTKYIIKKNKFQIIHPNNKTEIEIKNPTYKKEEMNDDLVQKFNAAVENIVSISQFKEKYQYSVCQNDDIVIYYVFSLDDQLWVASYANPNIQYIVKLK